MVYNNIAATVSKGSNPKAFLVLVSFWETQEVYDIRIVDEKPEMYSGRYMYQVIAEAQSREEREKLLLPPIA